MDTLENLWINRGKSPEAKFRYVDWNFRTKYFQIEGITKDGKYFRGKLDCGTEAIFPRNSDFWSDYLTGDEDTARAV